VYSWREAMGLARETWNTMQDIKVFCRMENYMEKFVTLIEITFVIKSVCYFMSHHHPHAAIAEISGILRANTRFYT
jgi:hypothetical protein